jgi:N-acetylneuraminic acid mutarotase
MLIWGGTGYSGELNDGGRYNPTTDTWTPITTTNAPIPRNGHSAIWTGAEMLVWGGYGDNIFFNDGAKYNPTTDTWIPITTTGAPSERRFHTAFWTGSEMLIWGGSGDNWALMENGAKYNPISDTWTSITTTNAPLLRYRYSAVWTGTEMFIWGGGNAEWGTDVTMYFNDGSKYNPSTDTWIPLPPVNLIPRWGHFSVWTGQEIIIWGGDTNGDTTFYDGAIYKP